ncbi:MAG: TlpA family protein disulfide reductase [Azospira oryzae]|nr:MAG: TlpA family protein disulfide reductase [Azospira oryzae]
MKRKLCFMASPCLSSKSFLGSIGIAVGVIIFCLFFNTRAYPQMALSIGDKLPDVIVTNVIHHSVKEVKLTDYKGKLLIIDFWATWCSPCISSFPKTDSLQKVFKDQVQFLPVTYESREKVDKLFSRSAKLKNVSLPIATSDNTLRTLFPHKELPHYIWIDEEGIVKAITGIEEVTADNIRKTLNNSQPVLAEKKDSMLKYDKQIPLLLGGFPISKDHLYFESLVTGYIKGLASRYDIIRDTEDNIQRITAVNATYSRLFRLAWSDGKIYFGNNRIVLDVKDKSKFETKEEKREKLMAWLKENSLCYEVIVPARLSATVFDKMKSDLAAALPQYSARVEKQVRKCLVLERISSTDKLKSKGGERNQSFSHVGASISNRSLILLIAQLNTIYLQHLETPVIDGTNYTNMVDLEIIAEMSNVESLRKALTAYDLDLVEKEIEIEVLVIRDSQ